MTSLASANLSADIIGEPDAGAVRLCEVGVQLGERWALRGVSIGLLPASVTGICGGNGAGKTTLLRVIAGLIRPTTGRVEFGGGGAARRSIGAGAGIGYVGHATMLYGEMTVGENLEFFARCNGVCGVRDAVAQTLESFGLADRRHDRVQTLSRGLQQRTALARALIHKPKVLLVDEPMAGLDEPCRDLLLQKLRACRDQGATVAVTGHDLQGVLAVSDRVIGLRDGQVVLSDRAAGTAVPALRSAIGSAS